jgi:hypothetical protein
MVELVAVFLSLAALVVSLAALYLTVLRPAEIEVDHVSSSRELFGPTFAGPNPVGELLAVTIFISNTGARGGLLEQVRLGDLEWLGQGEPYWDSVEDTRVLDDRSVDLTMPLVLEAGDVVAARLEAVLHQAGFGVEDKAKRVGGMDRMDRIAVTIRWAEFRTRGLLPQGHLAPSVLRRKRERNEHSTRIEIDASPIRLGIIGFWRAMPASHLVDLAEGKESPATPSA